MFEGILIEEGVDERAYVSVELSDEAREVVMLEVVGQEISGELGRAPDDERRVVLAPGDDVVCGGIVHQVVGLG